MVKGQKRESTGHGSRRDGRHQLYTSRQLLRDPLQLVRKEGCGYQPAAGAEPHAEKAACKRIAVISLTPKGGSIGRRTKTGCAWTPRGVRRVLENSIYCGDYVNNKCEVQDYLTGKRAPVPPEQRCHHPRPEWAIIPPALYEKAQALLTLRRTQYGAPNP